MKPEKFVQKISQSILNENIVIYKNIFESTTFEEVSDSYWKDALELFKKLNDKDKETLLNIMRQVSVDTISNLFSILDNVTCLEGQKGDFSLTLDTEHGKLNGDLQEIFLEMEEFNGVMT